MDYLDADPAAIRRRLRLRVIAKLMLATAFFAIVFVFGSAFLSGDKPGDPTPGLRVDIADIAPGATRTLVWDGRPVLVQRRDADLLAVLERPVDADALRDPDSDRSEQPLGALNARRSIEPEWFIAIALGTDYGCPVKPVAIDAADVGGTGAGDAPSVAFVDDCRGSRYDGAGRVFDGEYADRNLVVPPHRIEGGTLILGG